LRLPQKLRQLGDIRRDPSRLVAAFLIFVKDPSSGFDIIAPSPSPSRSPLGFSFPEDLNLKGRQMAAFSFPS
jgi:hypothetical protein